jgi:hypothetical protein
MRAKYLISGCLLALGACGNVIDEQRTTAVLPDGYYKGERYEIVTQTVQGRNGTYDRTRVQYWGRTEVCRIESPRDCEKAARRLIDQRFSIGAF